MDFQLKINKDYASKYDKWRQKEEYNRLKDKYGEEEEDSSSSEEEDDHAEGLTEQAEEDWFKTLAAIKSKDPKIYQKDANFYHDIEDSSEESSGSEEQQNKKETKKTKNPEKSITAQEYARKILAKKERELNLEEDGDDDDVPDDDTDASGEDDDEELEMKESELARQVPGYYEEQEQLKQSLKKAVADDEDEDDSADDLLVKRVKSLQEQETQDADYIEWLKGDGSKHSTSIHKDLTSLRDYWSQPNLGDGEKFLRDYILNKQYLDPSTDETPYYEDIVADEEDKDGDEVEEQELFEKKYNFRFEEPDQDFIKKHPRIIDDTLRKDDKKRAKKRKAVSERKVIEKSKALEEIKQLKTLKRMEIAEKMERLKAVTGNTRLGFDEAELDEDFDPQKYDHMMQAAFDAYDDTAGDDTEKPVFEYDPEIDDEVDWDKWKAGGTNQTQTAKSEADGDDDAYGEDYEGDYDDGYDDGGGGGGDGQYQPHCEDEDFNMDADYDATAPVVSKKSKRKAKKSKFEQALLKKKPTYNPDEKSFEAYYREYYDLDYEDIIGDMPCRFKYRQVASNDFGLDITEILGCRDQELNKWSSFKSMNQIRSEDDEQYLIHKFTKRARNENMKRQILPSLFKKMKGNTAESEQAYEEIRTKKKKKAKIDDPDELLTFKPKKAKLAGEKIHEENVVSNKNAGNTIGNKSKTQDVKLKSRGETNVESFETLKSHRKKIKQEVNSQNKDLALKTTQKQSQNETVQSNKQVRKQSKKQKLHKSDTSQTSEVITSSGKYKVTSVESGNNSTSQNRSEQKYGKNTKSNKTGSEVSAKNSETLSKAEDVSTDGMGQKKRRRRSKNKAGVGLQSGYVAKKKALVISDERLKAYGITNVKQFRYSHKAKKN